MSVVDAEALLVGRPGAGAVRRVLQSPSVRRGIRTTLSDLLAGQSRIGPCRIRRTKFKPGRKLTVHLDVVLPDDGENRAVVVTWRADDAVPLEPADAAATAAEVERRGLAAPFRCLTFQEPGSPMRIDVAPFDPMFPALARLSDPEYAAMLTGSRAPPAVTAVRYRPGERHVLRYRASVDDRGSLSFAKLYRDGRGGRTARVGHAVADLLAATANGVAAARPGNYLPGDRAVLIPPVPGTPLSTLLRRRSLHAGPYVQEAGTALRTFHDAPPDLLELVDGRTVEDELHATERASTAIRELLPEAGSAARTVIDGTRELIARVAVEAPVFIHGDYKGDHVLAGRRRVTIIDFDRCAAGDPALDLGKFLADLRWWLGGQGTDAVEAAQRRFLSGYGPAPSSRVARARALEPLAFLKIAARRVPQHGPDWEGRTATLVGTAAGLIDGLARA